MSTDQSSTETNARDDRHLGRDDATPSSATVSVIVPTFREAENIEELVQRVTKTFDEMDELLEIIIVDDNSQDGTDEKVAQLQQEGCAVRMIERTDERGLSSAVLRGFDEAQGDVLICMDADLSHPPESLPEIVDALQTEQNEMVVGSRYVDGGTTDADWGLFRALNSRVATWLARPFTSIKDPMAGFFALPRNVYQRTRQWDPIGYKIALEIIVKAGCQKVKEIPIQFEDRRRGESKLSFAEQLRYLQHLGRLARFKYHTLHQLAKFGLVGSSGTALDLGCFAGLMALGLSIPVARAIAIPIALTWNFFGNNKWTFECGSTGLLSRYVNYIGSCAAGTLTSYLVTVLGAVCIPLLAAHPIVLAFLGICAGGGINFMLAKHWVFVKPQS